MSSRLVETMMINVEDFSDSFLTCGTCLSGYDSSTHSAKLLPCSHTICRNCLERILETQQSDESFRCPICRVTIPVPQGGAFAFPPAFIVNQLLDLLASQRRDRVPKCRLHPGQELLFCETCDVIFCPDCRGSRGHATEPCGGNTNLLADASCLSSLSCESRNFRNVHGMIDADNSSNVDFSHQPNGPIGGVGGAALSHNVISFSIAIKRCSQILLYKAHLCVQELNSAQEAVTAELERLTGSSDACIAAAESSFSEIKALVERRQAEILHSVRRLTEEKRRALLDQLALIESERDLVKQQCDGLNDMMDVRSISKGISYLNDKLDTIASLTEPRENAFLRYQDRPMRNSTGCVGSQSLSAALFNGHHGGLALPTAVQLTSCPSSTSLPSSALAVQGSASLLDVARCLAAFGRIAVSTTYPPLCTAKLPEDVHIYLLAKVFVRAYDYHGQPQVAGTDPIGAHFTDSHGREAPSHLVDLGNGSYEITLLPVTAGPHKLSVNILSRPIRGSPFHIGVHARQVPRWCLNDGYDGRSLVQPFAVSIVPKNYRTTSSSLPLAASTYQANGCDDDSPRNEDAFSTTSPDVLPGSVLLLDTGNSRLLVMEPETGKVVSVLVNDALKGQAATGMALSPSGLWVVNWRINGLLLIDLTTNKVVQQISSPLFVEPTSVGVCPRTGRVLVADNGAGCIFECHRRRGASSTNGDGGEDSLCPGRCSLNEVLVTPLIDARSGASRRSLSSFAQVTPRKLDDGLNDALRRTTGICVATSGEIVLAAGPELRLYSAEGRHLGDLTPPFTAFSSANLTNSSNIVDGRDDSESVNFSSVLRTSTLPSASLTMNSSAPGSTLTLATVRRRPPSLGGTMRSAVTGGAGGVVSCSSGGSASRGHFGGVSMGLLAPVDGSVDDLGECILASHTDRSRSAVVVWPEAVWRAVAGSNSTAISIVVSSSSSAQCYSGDSRFLFANDGSNENLREDCLCSPRIRQQIMRQPFALELEPPMRRLAGLSTFTFARAVVAVDLGGQCAYSFRYA